MPNYQNQRGTYDAFDGDALNIEKLRDILSHQKRPPPPPEKPPPPPPEKPPPPPPENPPPPEDDS